MKKLAVWALAALSIFTLAGCGAEKTKTIGVQSTVQSAAESTAGSEAENENVQIPNPWQEVPGMEDAKNLAGFDLTAPDSVNGLPKACIQVLADSEQPIVEVLYSAEDAEQVTIRKAPGEGDISGVYNDYPYSDTLLVGQTEVSVRGGNQEACELAIWSADGYTYSVYLPGGVTEKEMAAVVAEVQ